MVAASAGPPMSARPGRLRASGAGIDPPVRGLAFAGVDGELGLGGAQQPHLGGDFGGQIS